MELYEYESAAERLTQMKAWNPYMFEELKSAQTKLDKSRWINAIKEEMKKDCIAKGVIKNAVLLLKEKYLK